MPIKYVKFIDRRMVRDHRESRFVFGDNVARKGYGGQAREMRDEPNSIGIATKWRPEMDETSFFRDDQPAAAMIMAQDFSRVIEALREGRMVYVPKDGLGTGLSQLPQRAPTLYAMLRGAFEALSDDPCPWEAAIVPIAPASKDLVKRVLKG